jgi:DNA repair protein RadC
MFNYDPLEGYRVQCVMTVSERTEPTEKMSSSIALYSQFRHMGYFDREHLVIACLNAKLQINAVHTVSIGTLTASVIHPREVFKIACISNAAGIILIHNHPSGDPTPSHEDDRITERIENAGVIMGIPLIDHLVVTIDQYYSYADSGVLSGESQMQRGFVMR